MGIGETYYYQNIRHIMANNKTFIVFVRNRKIFPRLSVGIILFLMTVL